MQEVDSERRLELLKGGNVAAPSPEHVPADFSDSRKRTGDRDSHSRKRRKLAGEDDTDRDIRYAREDAMEHSSRADPRQSVISDQPIIDSTGHINLIPIEQSRKHEKNIEVEAEKAKKIRELEDQYTMRFSNAAGFKQSLDNPWYSSSQAGSHAQDIPSKDIWGNEDPSRRKRAKARLDMNDPLASMRKGVKQLREAEKLRRDWVDGRQREIAELNRENHGSSHWKKHRKHNHNSDSPDRQSRHRESGDRSRHHATSPEEHHSRSHHSQKRSDYRSRHLRPPD